MYVEYLIPKELLMLIMSGIGVIIVALVFTFFRGIGVFESLKLNKKTILMQTIYILLLELININWIDLIVTVVLAVVVWLWYSEKISTKIVTVVSLLAGIYMGFSWVLSVLSRISNGFFDGFFMSTIPFAIITLIVLQIRCIAKNDEVVNKKKILVYISFVLIVLSVLWKIPSVVSQLANRPSSSNRYDDVFNKNPNDWTDEEKNYVDDLFNYIDEQD